MDPLRSKDLVIYPLDVGESLMPTVSLVVPFFCEEASLPSFFSRLEITISQRTEFDYELILVDDGSRDSSLSIARSYADSMPPPYCFVKVIELSRNFGKEAAILAGLDHVQGDLCILLDADLQDPPELIIDMLEAWKQGYELVSAVRSNRISDTRIKRWSASLFYKVFRWLSQLDVTPNSSDFRLLDRNVVDAIVRCRERVRFTKGFFAWAGFRQTSVFYVREARGHGASKWGLWRLWVYSLDGIFGYSTVTLRAWSYMGLIVVVLAIMFAFLVIFRYLLFGVDVPGYASLVILVGFLGGIQIVGLGLLGEYIGRTFVEVKRRPIYLIRTVYEASHD